MGIPSGSTRGSEVARGLAHLGLASPRVGRNRTVDVATPVVVNGTGFGTAGANVLWPSPVLKPRDATHGFAVPACPG